MIFFFLILLYTEFEFAAFGFDSVFFLNVVYCLTKQSKSHENIFIQNHFEEEKFTLNIQY